MPLRQGTSRHKEAFTQHDLWVTRSHPERPMEMLFANLPAIVRDKEPVEQADIVLWVHLLLAPRAPRRGRQGEPRAGGSGSATTAGRARPW